MGSGFSKMKKQAKLMQQQYENMQQKKKETVVTADSASGLVQVTLNGNKELLNIKINPECVDKEDIEGLQDLIVDAFNKAFKMIEDKNPSDNGLGNSGFPGF
jgi:nucleoid-associated protein EbfC